MGENGCLQNEHLHNLEVSNELVLRNPISIQGPKRTFSIINQSLTGIDGSSGSFSDNDVLMELGKLNISEISEDYPLPQNILIKDVVIMCHEAAGTTFACHLDISSTTGIAVNATVSPSTEVVGDGATYVSETLETVGTELDINLNSMGITSVCPNIVLTDIQTSYLYLVATTALSANITAGSFSLFMDYYVL